ncbi:MAG: antitoxin component YwqK of YwqJK toxin-antitoxin module, partial [Planctomycetota bacterium]
FEARWPTGIRRMHGPGAPLSEDGQWQYFYRSGQLREQGSYDSARRDGLWTQWFESGQRASSGERSWSAALGRSVRVGMWSFWHENGVLRARGTFKEGTREGEWSYFDNHGAVDARHDGSYVQDMKQ